MDSGDEVLWRTKAVVVVVRLNFGHKKRMQKFAISAMAELNRGGTHAGILRQMPLRRWGTGEKLGGGRGYFQWHGGCEE